MPATERAKAGLVWSWKAVVIQAVLDLYGQLRIPAGKLSRHASDMGNSSAKLDIKVKAGILNSGRGAHWAPPHLLLGVSHDNN